MFRSLLKSGDLLMGLSHLVGKYYFIDINLITNPQNIRVLSTQKDLRYNVCKVDKISGQNRWALSLIHLWWFQLYLLWCEIKFISSGCLLQRGNCCWFTCFQAHDILCYEYMILNQRKWHRKWLEIPVGKMWSAHNL